MSSPTMTTATKKPVLATGGAAAEAPRRHHLANGGAALEAPRHHHHHHHLANREAAEAPRHRHPPHCHRHPPHRHRHHEQEEDDNDQEEEEEEESEEEEAAEGGKDRFFESLDRVPSYYVDRPSDSDEDEEDDVRTSFASAVAPPAEFRCVTLSREEFLREHHEDQDDGRDQGDYDYDIWMAEPTSIKERRRRLLQGMGFGSKKDLAASLRLRSGSRKAIDPPAVPIDATLTRHSATAAASPAQSPHQPAVARCRSDTQLATTRRPPHPAERAASAPPTLWDHRARQRPGSAGDAGIRGWEEGGGLVLASGEICRIKNLDTGKEFVVSEFDKDGTPGRLNDLETGLQITMEEFERCLGYSPIVKELMRRANLGAGGSEQQRNDKSIESPAGSKSSKSSYRKKGSWLKNIKFVASSVTGLITEKEKGDAGSKMAKKSFGDNSSELMKVRQHGKTYKELTGLYMSQEIHAHQGSIWCIKFSWDGRYLASAGEDRVVRVWQVQECDILSTPLQRQKPRSLRQSIIDGSPENSPLLKTQSSKKTKKNKSGKSSLPDYIVLPEVVFSLSEKPVCSLEGHLDDILDLSWSKSQHLLSSSMDKTVRLWDMESKACLKLFAHNDYVTCIQFNPIDDRYFISGSLDSKVRIWSIPERLVVDWSDLHEMVTAACYTPDGQGALVGSHKGSCRLYKTSDCKLYQDGPDRRIKKKKSQPKKITGFQFASGNSSEVLITSADSRIRVFDGRSMVHKFRGFRNTSSQMSASYTSDGKYVICASEDSHVYVWKREPTRSMSAAGKSKGWTTTRSHEYFHCKDVSVAIPWPSAGSKCPPLSLPPLSERFNQQQDPLGFIDSQRSISSLDDIFHSSRSAHPPLPKKSFSELALSEELRKISRTASGIGSDSFASASASPQAGPVPSSMSDSSSFSSSFSSWGWYSGGSTRTSSTDPPNAWGLVVVTAGLDGDIRIYQNFGLPLRLSRQTNLF